MSITIGTPTNGVETDTIANSLIPYSHTVDSGTTLLVFIQTAQFSGGGSSLQFDTVTWTPDVGDAQSLTKFEEFTDDTTRSVSIWGLVNPTSGAGDIFSHFTNPTSLSGHYASRFNVTGNFYAIAASKAQTKESNSGDPSITYTITNAAGVVIDVFASNTEGTVGAGQTTIFSNQQVVPGGVNYYKTGASYKAHTGSDITMSYTGTTSAVYAGVEIIESVRPPQSTYII